MDPFIALYVDHVADLKESIEQLQDIKIDGLVCPIINPLHCCEKPNAQEFDKHSSFSRSDLILSPLQWKEMIISRINLDSIDCDSKDINFRKYSEEILKQEIALSQHLVAHGYIMIKLQSNQIYNLAKVYLQSMKEEICLVHVSITSVSLNRQYRRDLWDSHVYNQKVIDSWEMWNTFRLLCNFDPKIRLALELTNDIPSDSEIQRWLGEPVDCLIIPTYLFYQKNGKNILDLPYKILNIIKIFTKNKIYFMIKGNVHEYSKLKQLTDYVSEFARKCVIMNDMNRQFEDKLDYPLQPLYENLRCSVYEIFEADPVKYKYYQKAIEAALLEKTSINESETKIITLMILGAGRGPLIRAALNASKNTRKKIKIYAIEKNPNVMITLMALKEELWQEEDITIISSDMRTFNPSEKADIIVSELLGSFGDNELSPECLDEAQLHLKPDGISIPSSYTSYLNPFMSSKIYNAIKESYYHRTFHDDYPSITLKFECNYISHLKNVYHIAEPQECFKFNHPNPNLTEGNKRFTTLRFQSKLNCILNGFAGYFEAVLYKNITLSINPKNYTKGLLSWYSYIFPITTPQIIRAGDIIELNFWRCSSDQKVWYEWNLTKPSVTRIHNLNGKYCPIYK